MIVTPIQPTHDLFLLENIVSEDLAKRITEYDWMSADLKRQEAQEDWDRWMVDEHPLITEFEAEVNAKLHLLNQTADREYQFAEGTRFWIDQPNFVVGLHLDGQLPNAMQCYWVGNEKQGTHFYNSKNKNDLRYGFKLIPNTGYFMINDDPDNNALWHGMLNPADSIRITSYTYLR